MSKTINQALKDLFIGLGGDPSALADNDTVSDYIADLESAIKACAGGSAEDLIDDTESSLTKTYSSSKIETLIPEDELPAVTSTDNGNVLTVVEGAWNKATPASGYTKTVLAGDSSSYLTVATLSESYKNFDALLFEIQAGKDPETGDDLRAYSPYIPSDSDIGVHYKIPLVFDGNYTGYCDFTILSNTSIQWLDENCHLIKVIGVKF